MRNILLATDLASNSDRAMERAMKIAKEQKAKLYIIHIAPFYVDPKSEKSALGTCEDIEDLIHKYLLGFNGLNDVETHIIVRQGGEIFFEILEAVHTNKVDLVVMGMHGKEKFRDLFVGTTIERVVRKGITPVLMVREKPTGSYENIMAAIDFAPSSRTALRIGMELAPKAAFVAAHVVNVLVFGDDPSVHQHMMKKTEKTAKKNMKAFLKTECSYFANEHNGELINLSGDLINGAVSSNLVKKAKELKSDLITIGMHSKSGFVSKIGGVTGDVLSNPPCDVLVAQEIYY
ncbi:MAG: universal stress protein [Alphaproteobacteria bacterium]|nr:universal stress protein [Alphaproteobacteria bacterium]